MKNLCYKVLCILLCLTFVFVPISCKYITASEVKSSNRIIVSMGDSYSSGEGIEPFYGQEKTLTEKVKDEDWLAHRSKKSWPSRLVLDGKPMERGKNWFFVASSGAETVHIMNGQYKSSDRSDLVSSTEITENGRLTILSTQQVADKKQKCKYSTTLPAQIKVFTENNLKDKVDYVTLTLGGNDAKFAEVVSAGALQYFNTAGLTDKLNEVWTSFYATDGIRDHLRKAYKDISEAAGSKAKIIVAGYPKLLDPNGSALFSADSSKSINDSVSRFNDEIESLVNSCKATGQKICFVSVEDAFDGHGAYSVDNYINGIEFKHNEDIKGDFLSAYSMHPNDKGAAAYARCVQEKIDSIEKDNGKSEWPDLSGSYKQDVALVLDASGSMSGNPIDETKKAAKKFVDTISYKDVGIGAIIYDNAAQTISPFNKNVLYLNGTIDKINSGGGTNIEAGLSKAKELFKQSYAEKKYIVLMSDGEPNNGKVGDELVNYADSLKKEGFRIYTLGFFSSLSSKTAQQNLMQKIADDGCHYEVDDANDLVFFFDDIAEQLKGTKYYYIRIACPVDVKVSSNGETLSSKGATKNQRTSFGTMSFEESPDETESTDNRIKTLRLKEGENYNIQIDGNGKGNMSYTIGFMDEKGDYSDLRKFENIKITKNTKIETLAAHTDSTTLKVDDDGDGKVDTVYLAKKNSKGKKHDYKPMLRILLERFGYSF